MPVESTSIGIRPVSQPQRTEGTESVKSRGQVGSATSGFSPQTNVSIQNAVSDMAGVLSKIAGAETEAIEKMPQELQQVIDNVLQQAFSMDETLSQGLGSSVESQRFSLDQLSTMARMLSQLGHMADKGQTVDISSDMQALLTNLKATVTETGGSTFEPVLMAKAAFELLDNNAPENLSPELQQLLQELQPMGQTLVMQPAEKSEPMAFLRQLVEYMMPRPEAAAYTGEPYGGNAAQQSRSWSAYQDGYGNNNLAGQYSFQRPGGGMTEAGQIVRRQLAQLAAQEAKLNNFTSTASGQTGTTEGTLSAGTEAGETAARLTENATQAPAARGTNLSGTSSNIPSTGSSPAAAGQTAEQTVAGKTAGTATMLADTALPEQSAAAEVNTAGNVGSRTTLTNTAGAGLPGTGGQTAEAPVSTTEVQVPSDGQSTGKAQTLADGRGNVTAQAQADSRNNGTAQTVRSNLAGQATSSPETALAGKQLSSAPSSSEAASRSSTQAVQTARTLEQTTAAPTGADVSQKQASVAGQVVSEREGTVGNGTATAREQATNAEPQQPTLAELQQRMQTTDGPQRSAMRQAKAQLMSQTLENTPQTMHTLKDLAQLLLKNDSGRLSPQDTQLLQQAASSRQPVMEDGDAQALQRLIRVCQQNVPASVQQAALQNNLPDLPRVWAFMQLCDMSAVRRMSPRQLHKAGRDISAFVTSMRSAMEGDNAVQPGQRSLSFMIPLYMGEGDTGPVNYPSYIHVYNEEKQNEATGSTEKETWFRVCMLTANIGAVELTCRIYDEQKVDMRVFFSDPESAYEFRQVSDEIRQNLQDTKLQLKDFKVTTAG